jgi:hypothetical protein
MPQKKTVIVERLGTNQVDEIMISPEMTPFDGFPQNGAARYHYDHRIVPVKTERYSLTFRYLAQEEPVRSSAPRHESAFASLTA